MTRVPQQDDDNDDDQDIDPEGPDPSEMDDSDEPDLEVCPNCRKMITEETERCPYCGEYIIPSQAPMPVWMWVVIILIVVGMLALMLAR